MRVAWVLLAGAASLASPVRGQRIGLETLGRVDLWKTDPGSRLLARDSGNLLVSASLYAWAVYRASPVLELRVLGNVEVETADRGTADGHFDLIALRFQPLPALSFEAGKLLMPIGAFGIRRFPNTNPLIGAPDLYPPQYPYGVAASGSLGAFDFRAAVVSLPAVNPSYSPQPGHRLRPVVGAGVSFGPSLHIGAAATHGPYLGPDVKAQLRPDDPWSNYMQTVVAADLRYSVGYVETRAEVAWSSYEAPTRSESLHGFGWYVEARVTHSPRLFSAARFERYNYPFVRPVSPAFWIANETLQMNGELAVGYRVSQAALLKLSYRRDHWPGEALPPAPPAPDGYAIAAQLSVAANLIDLLTRRY